MSELQAVPAALMEHLDLPPVSGAAPQADGLFRRALHAIRTHMKMDIAFVSQFSQGRRVFRGVEPPDGIIQVGQSDPLEDSLCLKVVDGRVPELLPDARLNAEAGMIAAVQALPVGAHLSVPIRLSDGGVYGTLCCFSGSPDYSLNARDLGIMRAFAELVSVQVEKDLRAQETLLVESRRIDDALRDGRLGIVYQPIYNAVEHRLVGFEALARFAADPRRPPDAWFAEAARVGKGAELEMRAIARALEPLDALPEALFLSINASPGLIVGGHLQRALAAVDAGRIVVEVTEHEAVECYAQLSAQIAPLRRRGLQLAIDDAGAGYASFRHILQLAPDIIKLDVSITRDIDSDPSKRALAAALCRFGADTNIRLVAEGVETAAEWRTLCALGFNKAQGHFLGRPMPPSDALALARAAGATPRQSPA